MLGYIPTGFCLFSKMEVNKYGKTINFFFNNDFFYFVLSFQNLDEIVKLLLFLCYKNI